MSEVMEKLGITHDQWDYHKDSYESVIWKGDPACTKAEWDDAVKAVKNDYKNTQYQRDRASQYPSIQDQLDMLYHQGIDGWKAEIKKVKDAHPKPE
tara:strand:+ start:576 stop:863 length:288 start_codon:yes stop_codon:yes gene_type:complete